MAGAGIVFYAGVLIYLVLVIVIMIVLISRNAQTIGKKLMGIKIARTDGSRATLARIFWLRYVLNTAISMVPFFGGLYALCRHSHDLRRAAALLPRLHRRHDRHPGLNPAIDTLLSAETPEGIAISIRPAGFAVRANGLSHRCGHPLALAHGVCHGGRTRRLFRGRAVLYFPLRGELALSGDLRAHAGGRDAR